MKLGVERRHHPREDAALTAILHIGDLRQVCVIRNISGRGARLQINPDLPPPDSFDLAIPSVDLIPAVVRWRDGDQIGVRFGASLSLRARLDRVARWLKVA